VFVPADTQPVGLVAPPLRRSSAQLSSRRVRTPRSPSYPFSRHAGWRLRFALAPAMIRRDRHGRGARGPLAPSELPLVKSRGEQFDDLVLDAVEHLEKRWADELRGVEFAVEDVPPTAGEVFGAHDGPIPLARLIPAEGGDQARIVIYRRPLE